MDLIKRIKTIERPLTLNQKIPDSITKQKMNKRDNLTAENEQKETI